MLAKCSTADNKKSFLLILLAVLVLQYAFLFFYGLQKPNLFIDEWWSFNLANGRPSIITGISDDWLGKPILQPFWNEIITVKSQDMFDFHWVWENQIRDVHPPLYYLLLHILCGFWDGEFSLIPGLIINLIFFVGTQYLLWCLSLNMFNGDRRFAILIIALYGCSLGGMSAALSIRMYMMLTFFVTLMIYINIRIVQSSKRFNYLIVLCCVHVCGFLTQYYYIVYAFFAALPVLYKLSRDGRTEYYRSLIAYCVLSFVSLFVCWLIFPAFLTHILGNSTMGREAFDNLAHSDFIYRFAVFVWLYLKNSGIFLISVFSFFALILAVRKKICEFGGRTALVSYVKQHTSKFYQYCVLCFSIFFPFLIIAKVAPLADRYLMPLLPSTFLILIAILVLVINTLKSSRFYLWIIPLVTFIFVCETFFMFHIQWYWKDHSIIQEIVEKAPDVTFIAVIKNVRHPLIASQGNTLRLVNRVYIVTETDLSPLRSIPDDHKKAVLLWTQSFYPTNCFNLIGDIERQLGLKNGQILYNDFGKVRYYASTH